MSNDLGRLLKTAREERGLSLDQLQEITKIQKRYIEAIENEKFHLLPGPFYTRAFIRNISDTLNLNTEHIIKQYEGILPATSKDILDVVPRRKNRIQGPSIIGKWITTILMIAFVVLIFSIVYYFAVQKFPPKEQTKDRENSMDVVDNIDVDKGPAQVDIPPVVTQPEEPKEPEPPKPELTFVEKKDNTYYYTIANVKEMELTMTAQDGRCWYSLQKGRNKGIIKDETLELGNERTFDLSGLSNIYIHFGHTKAMKVELNGLLIDTSEMKDSERIDVTLIPLLGD